MAAAERQHVVDRLRGFALLGVLLVNTPFLLTSVAGASDASMPTPLDRTAGFLTWALFQAKSYVIFSFLFGYSLTVLLERVSAKGLDGRRVYRQRLLALGLLGAVHAVLLFVGDILVVYALLGTALVWLRRCSDRVLLRVAVVCYAAQPVVLLVLVGLAGDEVVGGVAEIDRSWATDGLLAATWTRIQVWPAALTLILALQGLLVLALFCVGLVAGRNRWLADPEARRPQVVRVRRWGWLLGLPPQLVAGALIVWPGTEETPGRLLAGVVLLYVTAPVLSAAYVATVALLPRSRFVRVTETDGTMSLTIYLGESLLMTTLAAGWGFGLFGLDTAAAMGVAVAVWLALSLFAHVWHRRVGGGGPAERLLRRLTYAGVRAAPPTPRPTAVR